MLSTLDESKARKVFHLPLLNIGGSLTVRGVKVTYFLDVVKVLLHSIGTANITANN